MSYILAAIFAAWLAAIGLACWSYALAIYYGEWNWRHVRQIWMASEGRQW
ncbi:MAG: hypothetical protein P4N59_03550 [Negativicutes bacterium]|nr:hypothetical protein [Negativicutes bacterium]